MLIVSYHRGTETQRCCKEPRQRMAEGIYHFDRDLKRLLRANEHSLRHRFTQKTADYFITLHPARHCSTAMFAVLQWAHIAP
jgi:hypothetical protein